MEVYISNQNANGDLLETCICSIRSLVFPLMLVFSSKLSSFAIPKPPVTPEVHSEAVGTPSSPDFQRSIGLP